MKSFFELRESLNEETMELAGVTFQNMEHCPGAVSAFKQNLKDGAKKEDVVKAAKAVDAYLAIEDKAKRSGATEADIAKMENLIGKAKNIISDLGLKGHTYHDMHLARTKKMMNEQSEDDMPATPDEKSMAMKQAKFIEYVADEIEEYLEKNKRFPEWMQNKLSAFHEKAKDMHAVLAGDYDDEEDEMNEEREPSGRFGQNVHDYKIKMNSRVAKTIKKAGPVHDTRNNAAYKAAHSHLQATGKKHGVEFDKLHHDITGHYAMAKPGQDKNKVHKALTDYEKTVGKHVK